MSAALRPVPRDDADRVEAQADKRDALAMATLAHAHLGDLRDALGRMDWPAAAVYRARALRALGAVEVPRP